MPDSNLIIRIYQGEGERQVYLGKGTSGMLGGHGYRWQHTGKDMGRMGPLDMMTMMYESCIFYYLQFTTYYQFDKAEINILIYFINK